MGTDAAHILAYSRLSMGLCLVVDVVPDDDVVHARG